MRKRGWGAWCCFEGPVRFFLCTQTKGKKNVWGNVWGKCTEEMYVHVCVCVCIDTGSRRGMEGSDSDFPRSDSSDDRHGRKGCCSSQSLARPSAWALCSPAATAVCRWRSSGWMRMVLAATVSSVAEHQRPSGAVRNHSAQRLRRCGFGDEECMVIADTTAFLLCATVSSSGEVTSRRH